MDAQNPKTTAEVVGKVFEIYGLLETIDDLLLSARNSMGSSPDDAYRMIYNAQTILGIVRKAVRHALDTSKTE